MIYLLKKFLLAVASLLILTQLIPSVGISNNWQDLFYSAFVLTVLLFAVKPLLNLVLIPLNLLTLNFFSWILQIIIFYIWIVICDVSVSSWQFNGVNFGAVTLSSVYLVKWQVVIISTVVFTIINSLLSKIFK